MITPGVSVVIVNWNHGHVILDCLSVLAEQAYPGLRVTVVDNASVDGSRETIAAQFPWVEVIRFAANRGFSAAFNAGTATTALPFVLSLNPDVTPRPGFVRQIVARAEQDTRIGIVAPKLLWTDDPQLLDSTGLLIDRRRCPHDRGQGERDRGQYDALPYAFGALAGAAALYRRAMLDDVAIDGEYLDEDFFAYYEDLDLAWRAQLRGWRCAYAPLAVAMHERGWGDTLRKRRVASPDGRGPRLALRNRYLTVLKNDALFYFALDLPRIAGAEILRLAYAAVNLRPALLGIPDFVRACPKILRKRRCVRSRQTQPDRVIRRWMTAPELAAGQDAEAA